MTNEENKVYDPLDMANYRIEKLPKSEKSGFEGWLSLVGGPLALLLFLIGIVFFK